MNFLKICVIFALGVLSFNVNSAGLKDMPLDRYTVTDVLNQKESNISDLLSNYKARNGDSFKQFSLRKYKVENNKAVLVSGKKVFLYANDVVAFPEDELKKLAIRFNYLYSDGDKQVTCSFKGADKTPCMENMVYKTFASINDIDCNKDKCQFVPTSNCNSNQPTTTNPTGRPSMKIKDYAKILDLNNCKGNQCSLNESQAISSINKVLYNRKNDNITMFLIGEKDPITFNIRKDNTAQIYFPTVYAQHNGEASDLPIVAMKDTNSTWHLFPVASYSKPFRTAGRLFYRGKTSIGSKGNLVINFDGATPMSQEGGWTTPILDNNQTRVLIDNKYIHEIADKTKVSDYAKIVELTNTTTASICF